MLLTRKHFLYGMELKLNLIQSYAKIFALLLLLPLRNKNVNSTETVHLSD